MNAGIILIIYIMCGIAYLLILDKATGRLKKKFKATVMQSRTTVAPTWGYTSEKVMTIIVIFIMVFFWPGILANQMIDKVQKVKNETK